MVLRWFLPIKLHPEGAMILPAMLQRMGEMLHGEWNMIKMKKK